MSISPRIRAAKRSRLTGRSSCVISLKVLLQKLGAAVPEDLAEALIDPQPGAVDSDIADADGGVLERAAKTRLAFAQRVLCLLALGDVEVEADP